MEFSYWLSSGNSDFSFVYLLTTVLGCLGFWIFIKSHFDILNPTFIVVIMFAFCCGLDALYTSMWNLPLHFNTMIVILVMILLFVAGGAVAEYTNESNSHSGSVVSRPDLLHINKSLFILGIGLMLFFSYLNYLSFLEIAHRVTRSESLTGMLYPVVNALSHGTEHFDRWYSYRMIIARGIAYVSLFACIQNLFANRYYECIKFGLFILLFLPFIVFTGGRQSFIYLFLFGMTAFILLYRQKYGISIKTRMRELIVMGIAFIGFFSLFWVTGLASGKIQEGFSFLRVLAHYAGTNISAFDVFLNEMYPTDSQYIGEMTLANIYRNLIVLGMDLPELGVYITQFVQFDGITTNVYTALRRYIQDYGFLGCGMIFFLLGFGYTKCYLYANRRMDNWSILIYASFSYPIFLLAREERFMTNVLSTSTIYQLIVLFGVYHLLKWQSK